jgi:hypothetical protein
VIAAGRGRKPSIPAGTVEEVTGVHPQGTSSGRFDALDYQLDGGAGRDRHRRHLHFTPTSSSWLNLIERWFKELTDRRLCRGVFTSVPDLTQAITTWAEHWNNNPTPFIWKATTEDIITKVKRGRETLNQIKTQTDH